jgi:3-hydroxybutyryl-CoA dehydratase
MFKVTEDLINNYASLFNDFNNIHISEEAAIRAGFKNRILHGTALLGILSSKIASKYQELDPVILKISPSFKNPAYLGDKLTIKLNLIKTYKLTNLHSLYFEILNQDELVLSKGDVTVKIKDKVQ